MRTDDCSNMSFASFLKHFKIKQMRSHSETRAPRSAVAFKAAVLAAAIVFWTPWALAQSPVSQAAATSDDTTPHVVLKKLVQPFYPQMARVAGIGGDVTIKVFVRADGSIQSVAPVSGDRLLLQAAMDSAEKSQFECRGCSALTEKHLTYTFRSSTAAPDPCCCTAGHETDSSTTTQISEPEGRITLTYPPLCVCPDACTAAWARDHSRFRSAKCLYLWKCGDHHYVIM